MFSDWLKMDLHIHSIASNRFKKNDYKGVEYDVDELIEALKREGINLFSITDHNCINKKLYKELLENRRKLLEEKLNFVVGCELDIEDNTVYNERFHCLVFFDIYDLDQIELILNSFVCKKQGFKPPDLHSLFQQFLTNGVENFILIPHFNDKRPGLKDDKMEIKAVECLKASVFNAYEDTNNLKNRVESFDVYKKHGYIDLPIFMFSDCHDLSVYPKYSSDATDRELTFLKVLGNIDYPFETLRLALQDAEIRIGSEKINYFRNASLSKKKTYVKAIEINDEKINMSPYQNTIIGGFGSGKTFLLNLILHGVGGFNGELKDNYGNLLKKITHFKIISNDNVVRDSLKQLEKLLEIIRFDQTEGMFYKTQIDESERIKLEEKLKITFPTMDKIDQVNFEEFYSKYNECETHFTNNLTDEINYGDLFVERNFYDIEKLNMEKYQEELLEDVNILNNELELEKNKKVFNIDIYSEDEIKKIDKVKQLIKLKNQEWNKRIDYYNYINKKIDLTLSEFKLDQSASDNKFAANKKILNDIENKIDSLYETLEGFRLESEDIEQRLSKKTFSELERKEIEYTSGKYTLVTKYAVEKSYEPLVSFLFRKDEQKSSLFKSLVNKIYIGSEFKRNRGRIESAIKKYYNEFFEINFSDFKYDIRKDGQSIMNKSAGEKANMIMEIIFELVEKNNEEDKHTILVIDQPEDHMDNSNINKNLIEKIRSMKGKNKLPQIIFVSHNANISITADSENIIIAEKKDGFCHYKASGIENPNFINQVCEVLEGGQQALKTRGIKFSVSYQKEFKKEEVE